LITNPPVSSGVPALVCVSVVHSNRYHPDFSLNLLFTPTLPFGLVRRVPYAFFPTKRLLAGCKLFLAGLHFFLSLPHVAFTTVLPKKQKSLFPRGVPHPFLGFSIFLGGPHVLLPGVASISFPMSGLPATAPSPKLLSEAISKPSKRNPPSPPLLFLHPGEFFFTLGPLEKFPGSFPPGENLFALYKIC